MSTEPSPALGGEADAPDERRLRHRRKQRRTVLAVAMAVLLAGGGGAYWASTAGGDGGTSAGGGGEPPRLALDGYVTGGSGHRDPGEGGKGLPQPGILPGEPTSAQTFRAAPGALPDGPESAAVHRPAAGVSRAEVAGLAKALDVPGDPKKERDRWTAGTPGKGSQPSLTVATGAAAGNNWTYASAGRPSAKGEPVSAAEAKDAARPALTALGLTGAEVKAGKVLDGLRIVEASPRIAGLPVQGWDSSFTVGPDGELLSGQGNLAKTEEGARYPLLSAQETLKRLNKQRPPLPSGADKPEPADVTGATLGLTPHQSHGKPVLVPSWLYTVDLPGSSGSGQPLAHPAVNPEYLKPAPGQGPMLPEPVEPEQPGGVEKPEEGGQEPGGGSGGEAAVQDVISYRAEGRTLELTFWGGVCDKYTGAAEETKNTVRVTVKAKDPDSKKICVKMAKKQTVEVELEKPLEGRKVVDARNGQAVPRG